MSRSSSAYLHHIPLVREFLDVHMSSFLFMWCKGPSSPSENKYKILLFKLVQIYESLSSLYFPLWVFTSYSPISHIVQNLINKSLRRDPSIL